MGMGMGMVFEVDGMASRCVGAGRGLSRCGCYEARQDPAAVWCGEVRKKEVKLGLEK